MWIYTSGARCAIRMLPIKPSLAPRVFALLRDSMVFLILRLWRIGTSDMNSTPPATIASHWPAAIRPTPGEEVGERRHKQRSDTQGDNQKNSLGHLKKVNFYKKLHMYIHVFLLSIFFLFLISVRKDTCDLSLLLWSPFFYPLSLS